MRVHAQYAPALPLIMFLTVVCAGVAAAGTASHQAKGTNPAAKGTRATCEAIAAAYVQRAQADVDAGESDPFTSAELATMHATVVTNCLKLGVNSSYVRSIEAQ